MGVGLNEAPRSDLRGASCFLLCQESTYGVVTLRRDTLSAANRPVTLPPATSTTRDETLNRSLILWNSLMIGFVVMSPPAGLYAMTSQIAQTFDNVDKTIIDLQSGHTVKQTVNPFGVVVESPFNGTFEHGNLHRGQRFPSNEIETPGWSLHGGDFKSDLASSTTFTVHEDVPGNYVAELNSLPIFANSQITHNRFYIPQTAQSLQFSTRVQSTELFRTGASDGVH